MRERQRAELLLKQGECCACVDRQKLTLSGMITKGLLVLCGLARRARTGRARTGPAPIPALAFLQPVDARFINIRSRGALTTESRVMENV